LNRISSTADPAVANYGKKSTGTAHNKKAQAKLPGPLVVIVVKTLNSVRHLDRDHRDGDGDGDCLRRLVDEHRRSAAHPRPLARLLRG
jgi:hypothetical protein